MKKLEKNKKVKHLVAALNRKNNIEVINFMIKNEGKVIPYSEILEGMTEMKYNAPLSQALSELSRVGILDKNIYKDRQIRATYTLNTKRYLSVMDGIQLLTSSIL